MGREKPQFSKPARGRAGVATPRFVGDPYVKHYTRPNKETRDLVRRKMQRQQQPLPVHTGGP
jgi:hypothetical protein